MSCGFCGSWIKIGEANLVAFLCSFDAERGNAACLCRKSRDTNVSVTLALATHRKMRLVEETMNTTIAAFEDAAPLAPGSSSILRWTPEQQGRGTRSIPSVR